MDFFVQTSRTCLGEMFPKLVISRFSWNNKSFLEQPNPSKKKNPLQLQKEHKFPKKKTSSQVSLFLCFCSSFWDSWSTFCSSKYMLAPPGVRHPEIGHSDPESAAEHHRHHGLHIGLDLGTRLLLPRGASDFREGKRGRFPKTMGVMNQTTMTQIWVLLLVLLGVLKKWRPGYDS